MNWTFLKDLVIGRDYITQFLQFYFEWKLDFSLLLTLYFILFGTFHFDFGSGFVFSVFGFLFSFAHYVSLVVYFIGFLVSGFCLWFLFVGFLCFFVFVFIFVFRWYFFLFLFFSFCCCLVLLLVLFLVLSLTLFFFLFSLFFSLGGFFFMILVLFVVSVFLFYWFWCCR